MQAHGFTGLYAHYYDLLFESSQEEIDFYAYFLAMIPGRALEVGCGTGNLMHALMKKGYVVDGIEPSQEMLEQCLHKMRMSGDTSIVYAQAMETLSLSTRYTTIYVPSCAFMLIDYEKALETLEHFYQHLVPGGQLLLSLFVPYHEICQSGSGLSLRLWKDVSLNHDQTRVLVYETIRYLPVRQQRKALYRFEVYQNQQLVQSAIHECVWQWYGMRECADLLRRAGFAPISFYGDYTREPSADHNETLVAHAFKAV